MPNQRQSGSYAPPSIFEAMQWCKQLEKDHHGRTRVLIEYYEDSKGRAFVCVAVQFWVRQNGDRFEGWASEEMRLYETARMAVGSAVMQLAHRLDHKLTDRRSGSEQQAHF